MKIYISSGADSLFTKAISLCLASIDNISLSSISTESNQKVFRNWAGKLYYHSVPPCQTGSSCESCEESKVNDSEQDSEQKGKE